MGGAGDSNTAHTYRGTKKGLLVVPGNEDVTLIHLHEIIGVNFHWPLFGIHLSAILDAFSIYLNLSSIIYITVHGYFFISSYSQSD